MPQSIALASAYDDRFAATGPRGGTDQQSLTDRAFETLVDAANPLQQIPGVGQVYRAATGDKSSWLSQLGGHVGIGAAVAGPIGAAAGAGVFVLEQAIPGVFRFIGKLFGSGSNSAHAASMPKMIGQAAQEPRAGSEPLASALDARPGARVARAAKTPAAQSSAPQLSSDQFALLMSSFGQAPQAQSGKADVAAAMQANLDKYRRQQQSINAR